MASVPNESQPLLAEDEAAQNRQPTPLPKLQISILMLLLLAEPVTSHCIYPFINQVSTFLRSRCITQISPDYNPVGQRARHYRRRREKSRLLCRPHSECPLLS